MRLKYPASLLTGAALILASTVVAAESPDHARYQDQVRANIIQSLALKSFASGCFMTENGLHALIKAHFDKDNDLVLNTQYYLGKSCSTKVDLQVTHRGSLQAAGHDLNKFRLSDHADIMFDRRQKTISFKRGTEVVELAQQEVQQ
jgi:hypothetical protein